MTKWKNRKNGRIEIVSPDEGIRRLSEASEWGSSHTHKTLFEPRVLQTLVFWTFTEALCYAFLSSAIGLFCFQASIPLWIIRLDSQSDGKNTSSCAILFEIPPAGMMLRHVPYKYLDSLPSTWETDMKGNGLVVQIHRSAKEVAKIRVAKFRIVYFGIIIFSSCSFVV